MLEALGVPNHSGELGLNSAATNGDAAGIFGCAPGGEGVSCCFLFGLSVFFSVSFSVSFSFFLSGVLAFVSSSSFDPVGLVCIAKETLANMDRASLSFLSVASFLAGDLGA